MYKIAIFQEEISNYNVDLYNYLSERYDLTIYYNKPAGTNYFKFKIKRYKLLTFYNIKFVGLSTILSFLSFDAVILLFNLRWPTIFLPVLFKKFSNTKFILWGIGVSASYTTLYDSNKSLDFLRLFLIKKSNATIFYSNYPLNKYYELGIDLNKLFVANNTIYVNQELYKFSNVKDSIIFIGTLYKEKGIMELLESFFDAYNINTNIPNLIIVGNGPEFNNIKTFLQNNNLLNKINLYGSIYDDSELANLFIKSYICISPNQAGLSVLKSMGFGVPFVTKTNAITGGEIFNIIEGYNGLFYKNKNDLVNLILNLSLNSNEYFKMGENAFQYYQQNCTLEKMALGFENAIKYSLNIK